MTNILYNHGMQTQVLKTILRAFISKQSTNERVEFFLSEIKLNIQQNKKLDLIRKHILNDSYVEQILDNCKKTETDIRITPKEIDTQSIIFVCMEEYKNILFQYEQLLKLNLLALFKHELSDLPLYIQFCGTVRDINGRYTQEGYLLRPIHNVPVEKTSSELLNILLLLQGRIFGWPDWQFYNNIYVLDFDKVKNEIPSHVENKLNTHIVYDKLENEITQLFGDPKLFSQVQNKKNIKLPDNVCMLTVVKHDLEGENKDQVGANSFFTGELCWGCLDIQHKS